MTRMNVNFTARDLERLTNVQGAYDINKATAIRHALLVADLLARGEATLIDENKKPFRVAPN